jgi:hypothetical protein
MANVFPNSNLATSSQPWGREVQKRVETLESQLSLQRTNGATVDAQLQSSYRRLDETVKNLIQADLDIQAALGQSNQAIADAQAAADDAAAAASTANSAATNANNAINGLIGLGSDGSAYTLKANNITSGGVRDGVLTLSSGSNSYVSLFNGGVDINGPSAELKVGNAGGGGTLHNGAFSVLGGTLTAGSTFSASSTVFFPGIDSSTSAANMRWGTGGPGRVQYSTASSRRFKNTIVSISEEESLDPKKLLDIPVVAFKYNEDYLSSDDLRFNKMIPGFIAEDIEGVYKIAAENDGIGASDWNPRYVIPGMLALIQELYTRIEVLENKDKV